MHSPGEEDGEGRYPPFKNPPIDGAYTALHGIKENLFALYTEAAARVLTPPDFPFPPMGNQAESTPTPTLNPMTEKKPTTSLDTSEKSQQEKVNIKAAVPAEFDMLILTSWAEVSISDRLLISMGGQGLDWFTIRGMIVAWID